MIVGSIHFLSDEEIREQRDKTKELMEERPNDIMLEMAVDLYNSELQRRGRSLVESKNEHRFRQFQRGELDPEDIAEEAIK